MKQIFLVICGLIVVLISCSSTGSSIPNNLINEEELTTSIDDAYPVYISLITSDMGEPEPIDNLPVDEDGFKILSPGYYYQELN